MKYLLLLPCLALLVSCGDNKRELNIDSIKTDSALRAQEAYVPPTAASPDTMHAVALPPVFEGDIVMQISEDPAHLAFGTACGSKYNHAGIIFIRPRDRLYVVMEANDSVGATPLTQWVDRGQGDHVVVMRLKNSNQILNEKKTEKLKKGAKEFRGKREDKFYGWSDEAFYSTELVWKMYENALNIEICVPGKLGDMNITGALLSEKMKKRYGANIPKDEKFISPDAIYKSPKLEIIYER
ncbi:hypothetical protein BH11BAC7_BH11BAC7_34570 [soil metagenome]